MNGKEIDYFPANINDVKNCKPVYKEFEGWEKINKDAKNFSDLSNEVKGYLGFIEKKLEIPIALVSIGPGRNETIEI